MQTSVLPNTSLIPSRASDGHAALPPFATSERRGAPTLVGLQYLRAVAALLVVYYHAVIQVRSVYGLEGGPMLGRSGVDIFFVLSGFVMWTSTASGRVGPGLFLRRRIARIVPLYWAVTLAAAGIALVMPKLLRHTGFDLPHVVASLLFVPWTNPMALRQGIEDTIVPIVVPGWTLNFEMMFYVLFAAALLFARSWRPWGIVALVAGAYLAALALRPLGAAPQFYAQTIIFEFLAGVGLAMLTLKVRILPLGVAFPLLIGATAALLVLDAVRPSVDRLILLGLPALTIVAAMVAIERHGRIGMVGWLDLLGNASYSIYLVHIYVIAILRVGLAQLGLVPAGLGAGFAGAFIGAAIVLSAVGGIASYRWLEVPSVKVARWLLRA